MAVSIVSSADKTKHELAAKLSERMGEFRLDYDPRTEIVVNRETLEGDPASKGHQFYLDCAESEFPRFGFEVWVDDRSNNGDLAQSVVDELFSIANQYMDVANRMAERLNREPKGGAV